MGKKATRVSMIASAGIAGGCLAVMSVAPSTPARVVLATIGGAFVGLALYFHGALQRAP
jgi:hypothetical protein